MRIDPRRIGVVLSVTILAACGGGGGGGGAGSVALKTEADVIREVGNLSTLYVGGGGGPAPASTTASTRQTGVKRLATRSREVQTRMVRAKSTNPKVAVTEDCPNGGSYTYEDFFETPRALSLFDANPVMDYYVETDRDCRFIEGTSSEYYDGYFEFGDNGAYATEGGYYEYSVDGSGGTPFRQIFQDTDFDEKLTIKTLGRYEAHDTGVVYESREILDLDFTYAFQGDSFNVGAKAGESGNPLIFVDNYGGDGSVSIDGPIFYDTDFCDSGRVDYTTVQNLTFAFSDVYGDYVSGGELLIESGSTSVSLVFAGDGTITYTFEGGGTGQVTLEELNTNAEECVFFPG